ncbi:MAG: hypothetical protein WCO07_03590 [bacterium]
MIEIKDLLFKFDHLLVKEEVKKLAICDAINQTIKAGLETKDIKIKNNIVYLNIKPIYKNEIFLKKELLSLKLKESLGKMAPESFR